MRVGRMRQNPTERPGHVAVGANEPIVQYVPLHVLAQSAGIGRPNAAGHFVLVDQAGWTGHYLSHAVDAVHETIAGRWILVLEIAVGAWTSFARLWFL